MSQQPPSQASGGAMPGQPPATRYPSSQQHHPQAQAQAQQQQQQQQPQAYYHPSAGRGGGQPYGGRGGYNPRHNNNNNNRPPPQAQAQQQTPPGVPPGSMPLGGSWQPTQAGAYVVRGAGQQPQPQPYNPAAAYGGYPAAAVYGNPAAYGNPYPPGGSWQATTYHHPRGAAGTGGGGQTYYPPAATSAATSSAQQPPAPKKKMLTITDKDGNVIDLSNLGGGNKNKNTTPKTAAASTTSSATTSSTTETTAPAPPSSSNAGAKLRQAALERLEQGDAAKQKAAQEAKEAQARKQKQAQEEEEEAKKAQEEAMAKLKAAAEEEAAKKKLAEEEAAAKKQAEEEEAAKAAAAAAVRRVVLSKQDFLRFKDHDSCLEKIPTMPDMTIVKGPSRGSGGRRQNSQRDNSNNNNNNDSWKRGNEPPRRQSKHDNNNNNNNAKDSWARGSALPPPPKKDNRNNNNNNRGGRGGGGRNNNNAPLYDGPVAPLVKSANHWRPKASTNALVVAEKQVKSILNKMTKEKFARLAQQMTEIPVQSYETLTMMIENVYDKAIDEPSFGDIYADLCVRLSDAGSSSFVHIVTSDEEPPTEGDADDDKKDVAQASKNTVYRWSNNVDVSDSEIVGPFASEEECKAVAVDQTNDPSPVERGEMTLELVSVSISQGMFIKVMKQKDASEGDDKIYYTVYFPVSEAKECGQQLSDDIFLSQPEAESDATKKNSFKRSLLNKCEAEFNKQDIYKDWKEEKAKYEASKSSLTEAERAEKEEEMDFRRIRIKKQMLGNIKFIGQLFKKNLLKEKIMRYCIATLLKLQENKNIKSKNPEYEDSGDKDMDEEDHEAICSMFTTIGSTIDKPSSKNFVELCFGKIADLSTDKALPSRSRFMYKDLLDLRKNKWVPRRKEEKAKTLDEIRKDVEREEQKQAEISQRENQRQSYRGGGGRGGDFRQSGRQQSNRPRPKQVMETDDDGFTTISNPKSGGFGGSSRRGGPPGGPSAPPVATKASAFAVLADEGGQSSSKAPSASKKAKPLDDEQLERRIKSIRSDFVGDGGNVDELRLSMEELSATPEAGVKMVQQNSDRMMDCKEAERVAIIKILTICAEKKWISADDVKNGLMDGIEFIDSIVYDAPKAFDYMGELLAGMLRIGAIDVAWICEQAEKTKVDPDTQAPSKLVKATIQELTKSAGASAAKSKFGGSSTSALSKLLGDDGWKAISGELL